MNAIFLRRALLGDAVFETVCALVFIVGANTLAASTGWQVPAGFIAVGGVLAAAAALLYWMARQPQINLPLVRLVMCINAVGALVGVFVLVAFGTSLTDGARLLLGIIALGVGIFAVLEYRGLRVIRA